MPTALEVELKTYAHQMVADHVTAEYDSQIGKWQAVINQLVDKQAEALKRHQEVLDNVRKQKAEQQAALHGLAMLALSFVSGPILSWVGGKIEEQLYPKYKQYAHFQKREVLIANEKSLWPQAVDLFEKEHNKVHAKIFGDLGAQVAGLGTDKAIKVIAPAPASAADAKKKVDTAAMSNQGTFRTNLNNALLAEAGLTSKAIMNLAMSILENQDYGAECLAKLKRVNAAAKRANITERELETLAKQMIREDINTHRKGWSDKWFYYGNDPVWTGQEAAAMERELWGLWLLNEDLKPYNYDVTDSQDGVRVAKIYTSKGLTFGDPGVPELVLQRLAQHGVVEARTPLQKLQAIAAKEARDRLDAAREAIEDEEAAKAYRKALEAAEGAEDPARERNQVTRQQFEDRKQQLARRAQERKKNEPPAPIVVGDDVDTQAEIDALKTWALNHPVTGRPKVQKRAMPSVENVHQ